MPKDLTKNDSYPTLINLYLAVKGVHKKGKKSGEAASLAFKEWVQQSGLRKLKDVERLRVAAQIIHRNRVKLHVRKE